MSAREVEEEIGVNISSLIDENEFVFHTKKGVTKQETTLYIIPGVSEQTHFATYTREEISQICWHPIGNLDPNIKTSKRVKGVRYFGVHEFYYGLTQWIKSARKKNIKIQNSIDAPMNSPGQFIAKQYVESDDEDDDYGEDSLQSKPWKIDLWNKLRRTCTESTMKEIWRHLGWNRSHP